MVLNCEPERWVALITDYNNEECQIIKTSLLGANQGQSHWFGLSSFAGHIDPDMTFKHYIHTAHLTAGLQQHQVKIRIPLLLLEKLTNLDYQNIYHINKKTVMTKYLKILSCHYYVSILVERFANQKP